MLQKKTTKDYVKVLAEKYNLTHDQVRKILNYGGVNITKMIEDGEDVFIKHFGSIYFEKTSYAKYIKAARSGNNKTDPDDS